MRWSGCGGGCVCVCVSVSVCVWVSVSVSVCVCLCVCVSVTEDLEEEKIRGSIEALKIPSDPDSTQKQIFEPPKNENPQKEDRPWRAGVKYWVGGMITRDTHTHLNCKQTYCYLNPRHTYTYRHTCIHTHTYIHRYIGTHIQTCIQLYMHSFILMQTYSHAMHAYIHTCIDT